MMTLNLMTSAADAAGARYQVLVDAWSAAYQSALALQTFGSARAIEDLGQEAYGLARTYLAAEERFIAQALADISSDALTDATADLGDTRTSELSEPASELVSATQGYLMREITIQIERDIAQLQHAMRQTALQVKLAAAAQGITPRAALFQLQIGSNTNPELHFRDRRAAKWPSRLFIRTTWRQSLLSVFNEVTLTVLADAGISFAEVRHTHGKAGVHGMQVSMGSNSALPAYGEIRNDIFHPNAEALLVVPVQHRIAA